METIKIRKATRKDIPQLVGIVKGVKSIEDYPGEYSKPLFEKMLEDDETIVLVAEINKRVVGFHEFSINHDNVINVESIADSKKHQGKGIASILLDEMEKYAKRTHVKRIAFIVRDWNGSMNHLAEKRGYKIKNKFNYWEKTSK